MDGGGLRRRSGVAIERAMEWFFGRPAERCLGQVGGALSRPEQSAGRLAAEA